MLQEKIRSQLRVSGLPFSVYWLGFFIVELLKFLIPCIMVIIVVFIVQVSQRIISTSPFENDTIVIGIRPVCIMHRP